MIRPAPAGVSSNIDEERSTVKLLARAGAVHPNAPTTRPTNDVTQPSGNSMGIGQLHGDTCNNGGRARVGESIYVMGRGREAANLHAVCAPDQNAALLPVDRHRLDDPVR